MDSICRSSFKGIGLEKICVKSRPANAHGFAVRLMVLDQIFRSHGCYLKPHGFLAFLAIKNPHHLAYNFEYGRPVFIYKDSPYLNKHSETPKNSGNTVIIREILLLVFSESSFYPHNFGFDGNCRWRVVADQDLARKEVTFC